MRAGAVACAVLYRVVDGLCMNTVDNSEQICAVATRLFARRGFDGTSLQSIADEVGVAKQTLLYHYSSKEVLRQRVLSKLLEHWGRRLPKILAAVTSGPRRFEALTEELLRFFRDDPDRARLLVRELLDNPTGMSQLLADKLRPWLLLVGQYVREGQAIGLVHADVDPEAYLLNTIVTVVVIVAGEPMLEAAIGARTQGDGDQRLVAEQLRASRRALFTRQPRVQTQPAVVAGTGEEEA